MAVFSHFCLGEHIVVMVPLETDARMKILVAGDTSMCCFPNSAFWRSATNLFAPSTSPFPGFKCSTLVSELAAWLEEKNAFMRLDSFLLCHKTIVVCCSLLCCAYSGREPIYQLLAQSHAKVNCLPVSSSCPLQAM